MREEGLGRAGDASVTGANTVSTRCSCLRTHNEIHCFVQLVSSGKKETQNPKPVNIKKQTKSR